MSVSRVTPATRPDVLAWARTYLPHYFTDEPSPFHAELLATFVTPDRRLVARVAPRGHAKSTCAALAYPLWCICTRRRRNIVIITHETSLATQFVRDIRAELDENDRLREAYGDLTTAEESDADELPVAPGAASGGRRAGRRRTGGRRAAEDSTKRPRRPRRAGRTRWSARQFVTATGISVQAKGTGASFRGTRCGPHRPDLVVCDDLEKDEHVASAEMRRKLEHWLRRVVMPALAPGGQLVVLGSIIHYDALLANLRDRQRWPRWDYCVYRALEARPSARGDGTFEHVALWPARWPVARLLEERERIGTLAFDQEYQANPIDDTLRVFRPEWLRRYDAEALVEARLIPLMAVDPATGKADGDYFALWVGAVDTADGRIYTRELTLERIGIVEQVRRIVAAFKRWRPVKIGIEAVAYQVALQQVLEEEGRRLGVYLPVVPLKTTANKRARIEGSAPFFENGTFWLPRVLPAEVEEQFLHFPKARHDDAPDVCAMGVELARALRAVAALDGAVGHRRRGEW